MSRLLPDMVSQIRWCGLTRVLVTADSVLAEHWSAGIQSRRVVAQDTLESMEPLALQAAMTAVISQLPSTDWQRIEIYLADQHVHLMLLPAIQQSGQANALSGAELQAYARAILLKTYGEAAVQWPLRMQDVLQSHASLLATTPVLQNIAAKTLVAPRKYLQLSVQPYACALWAHTRLPADGTIVSAEPHMLRLLQLQQGEITHVASLVSDLAEVDSMAAWLLRERTLLGVQASACYWLSEPACEPVAAVGRRLSQHLAGRLTWKNLYSANAITSLWQEVAYVA
ncbi:MAG TPA: hypothetical protein VK958_05855 [Methylophilus sp.]|uniref:hypothetical protein n=1 Tax=Methylophilus sp. TaxID=29541 RepID=UPI002B6B86FA|nr:hypothetical protein [Methylophilus sp.]HSH86762.1 hypothetical protein [Methylophilus sp.]